MMRALLSFTLCLSLAAATLSLGCADDRGGASSADSEVSARTTGRRAKLARLSSVNALARLYLGHELDRRELSDLGSKSEAAVVAALVARSDFRERFAARVAEYRAATGRAPASEATDPDAPLDVAVGAGEGGRFARWLLAELAPRVAHAVVRERDASLGSHSYTELLQSIREASVDEEARR